MQAAIKACNFRLHGDPPPHMVLLEDHCDIKISSARAPELPQIEGFAEVRFRSEPQKTTRVWSVSTEGCAVSYNFTTGP